MENKYATEKLIELFYIFLLPTLGFIGGLLWPKILEGWRLIGARAQYKYHQEYLPSDIIITLDSAIPSFELDSQSIAPTEEKFFLRPLAGIGLEQHNEQVANYHKKPPFVFGQDEVFGSHQLSKLEQITGIQGLAERVEQAREQVSYEFLNKQKGSYFNGKKMGLQRKLMRSEQSSARYAESMKALFTAKLSSAFYKVRFMGTTAMWTYGVTVSIAPTNRFKSLERFFVTHSGNLHQT